MQVKSILSRIFDTAPSNKGREAAESAARRAVEAPSGNIVTSAAAQRQLREILTKYDVTSISPRAFSELLQELQQASLLPDKDLHELFQIRADLDRENIAPDQRVNLLEMYRQRLKEAERAVAEAQDSVEATSAEKLAASLRRRVEWLGKFAAIHAEPEGAAVNAWA